MIDKIIEVVRQCQRFLITSHVRLDGDALGSELAFYLVLKGLGKDVVVFNEDPTPENYLFLPGAAEITHHLEDPLLYEAAFLLDCSELERVGRESGRIAGIGKVINIDHHLSNDGCWEIKLLDPQASSTGELIWRIIKAMGISPTVEVATNLYTAILTDTGSFHYSNTTPEALKAAGELVAHGASPQWISQNVYENEPAEKMKLFGRVLDNLSLAEDGKVVMLTVRLRDIEEIGAKHYHTEGFVDAGRKMKGVLVSTLFTETDENVYKVSMRSKDDIDIEQVARVFGGGGHRNAAAFRIEGKIEAVQKRVLEVLKSQGVV